MMISKPEALKILKKHVDNPNLIKHSLATQAVMESLAHKFNEKVEIWSLAGLLHDIDYTQTFEKPYEHGLIGSRILTEMNFPEEIVYAVKCHNEIHGFQCKSLLDKVLYAVDPLTGLIVAGALITKEKKLKNIDVSFLLNRFNEKSFARGANREQIASCKDFNISLEEFIEIGLKAMQSIDKELGL